MDIGTHNEEALAKTHTHSNACYLLSCSQIPHEDKWMGVQNLGHNHMAGRGIMAIMPAPRAPPAA